MAFCTSCGKKNEDVASFCNSCGKPIQKASPDSPQHNSDSAPNAPSFQSSQDEAAIKKQKMKDRGLIGSIYDLIFVEKDIDELWKAYLGLSIIDGLLGLFLHQIDMYGHGVEIELGYELGFTVIILGILNSLVKHGVSKRNEAWVLVALILSLAFFVLGQIPSDDGISDYDVVFNVFSNPNIHGGLAKLYTFLATLWDTLIGGVVEILLLARIIFVIRALKR